MSYFPEGTLIDTPQNKQRAASLFTLGEAAQTGDILEGRAIICDAGHNLTVELPGGLRGFIPRAEGAIGIEEGQTRDIAIISRVNKPVCFVVTGFEAVGGQITPILSRRVAQRRCMQDYISQLRPGQIIDARVAHLEAFGCFVDVGCGIPSMVPIDAISVSRISHPRDRFCVGQNILAVVKSVSNGRVCLTHKELLGTWEENAARFSPGETVAGVVRSVESYGVFVELTPNLAGLAEPRDGVRCGMHASVYIKSLIPQKMKVKLIIIDAFAADYPPDPFEYHILSGQLDAWRYSPDCSERVIETIF